MTGTQRSTRASPPGRWSTISSASSRRMARPQRSDLAAKLGSTVETARELCYRLYTLCERKKRAAEALSYNALVQSWPEITRLAREEQKAEVEQTSLFANEDTEPPSPPETQE